MSNFLYILINCFQDAGTATLVSSIFHSLPFNVKNSPNEKFPTSNASLPFSKREVRESNKSRKISYCKLMDISFLSNRACNWIMRFKRVSPIATSFFRIAFSLFSPMHPFVYRRLTCPLLCTFAMSDSLSPSLMFFMGFTSPLCDINLSSSSATVKFISKHGAWLWRCRLINCCRMCLATIFLLRHSLSPQILVVQITYRVPWALCVVLLYCVALCPSGLCWKEIVLCLLRIATDDYAMSFDTLRCIYRCHVYICMNMSTACVHLEASCALDKHMHEMNHRHA